MYITSEYLREVAGDALYVRDGIRWVHDHESKTEIVAEDGRSFILTVTEVAPDSRVR